MFLNASNSDLTNIMVTVSTSPTGSPPSGAVLLNFFPTPPSTRGNATFALCTKPLYGEQGFDDPNLLIQYIEYYKEMGASHLILYNQGFSKRILCLLDKYIEKVKPVLTQLIIFLTHHFSYIYPIAFTSRSQGFVSLHKWNLGALISKNMTGTSQVAAHADCLYRYIGRYKYVVISDPDELIVPNGSSTLTQLLSSLESQKFLANIEDKGIVKKKGSFSFVNAIFPLEKGDDNEWLNASGQEMSTHPLVAARKTHQLLHLTHSPER